MYKAEPGATRIHHEDASADTAHARRDTASDLLDQRAESATQRRLLALANGSPRQMRLAAAGSAPIQRRIDDEQQRALVPELVRKVFGPNADQQTIDTVSAYVIQNASNLADAQAVAIQNKIGRSAIPDQLAKTGTKYDATALDDDKRTAMAIFAGLPGHTNPDTDREYFTWHHIVPQSRLSNKQIASKTAAVRLGPSASHRYSDPGDEYTDPNYSTARDGSLTPDSEAIEAYHASIRNQGGLAALLTSKVEQLAEAIAKDKTAGKNKALADPGQWLIFGDFLLGLPGMTEELRTELQTVIGKGYTVNKGKMETHDFASWHDLREKQDGDQHGVSPALFKVLDAGIKAYQDKTLNYRGHDGKIFARGYKEGNPVVTEAIRRKETIDRAWFADHPEDVVSLASVMTRLDTLKSEWGPWIVKANRMAGHAHRVNDAGEKAFTALGDSWRGTSHGVPLGTDLEKVDKDASNHAADIVASMEGYADARGQKKQTLAHRFESGSMPPDSQVIMHYARHVPDQFANTPIPHDAINERMNTVRAGLVSEWKKRENKRVGKKKSSAPKGPYADMKNKQLRTIVESPDSDTEQIVRTIALRQLEEAAQSGNREKYNAEVVSTYRAKQDEHIQELNTASRSLVNAYAVKNTEQEQSEVDEMTSLAFSRAHLYHYEAWEQKLRLQCRMTRMPVPQGTQLDEVTEEAWNDKASAYRASLAELSRTMLPQLEEKILTSGKAAKAFIQGSA